MASLSAFELGQSSWFCKTNNPNAALIRTIVLLGKTLTLWELLTGGAVPYAATIGLFGFLVWSALKFRAWYHNDSGLAADEDEMLLQFRNLQRRGDLTAEEFRSIKGRLVDEFPNSPPTGTDTGQQQGCDIEEMSDHQIGPNDRNDK